MQNKDRIEREHIETYSIGVDIGGTKCAVVLGKGEFPEGDMAGFLIDRVAFLTEVEKGPEYALERIQKAIRELLVRNKVSQNQVIGIGISCGSPLDHQKGVILNPPNLYGWNSIPIVKILEEAYGIPAFLQNDANAGALAEWYFGAARGYKNAIFLTCGTGMGAGLILNGHLYNGTNDLAGEIGHIRMTDEGPVGYGKAGSYEGYCSGGGIAQIARTKVMEYLQTSRKTSLCADISGLSKLTAKFVAEEAYKGDELAREVYRTSGYYMGRGMAILIDILNPEIIVIGGIFERSKDLLLESIKKAIRQEALATSVSRCRIVPAMLGDKIGDYAALSVAIWKNCF